MATEDRAAEVEGAEASPPGPDTNGSAGKVETGGVEALKARVAAKRGAAGKQAMIQGSLQGSESAATQSEPTASTAAPADAPLPADHGVPDGEITPAAKDELARLASIREADEAGEEVDPEQAVMDGLAAEGVPDGSGGSLYEKRQAEIAAAKARPGGKASGKAAGKGLKAKVAAKKESAKDKKEKERAKLKEKSEKQKDKERERKEKEKEKKDARAQAEKERKAKLAEQKAERAKERAAKRVPDLMAKENKALQAAFAEDYSIAGPKTDRNPEGIGLRRAKADRGDFAAGYLMALRRIRRQAREQGDTQLAGAAA